jgi:hypothetical protein
MTLDFYVGKDKWGHPDEYHTTHEFQSVRDICADLFDFCGERSDFCGAVIANSQGYYDGFQTEPDLVIITEYGIGVLELKHNVGIISVERDGNTVRWFREKKGERKEMSEKENPQIQVQNYAKSMRNLLTRDEARWLPSKSQLPVDKKHNFEISTGVCYTNPWVQLRNMDEVAVKRYFRPGRELLEWEKFSIFRHPSLYTPNIKSWVASLRFEDRQGVVDGYSTYKLSPEEIDYIANHFFNVVPWTSMIRLIEDGIPPYGRLNMRGSKWSSRLNRQQSFIGRSRKCRVKIPNREEFRLVSAIHARIFNDSGEMYIENLGRNGTYINGKAITKPIKLKHQQKFILGSPVSQHGACELFYVSQENLSPTETTWVPEAS